MFKYDELKHEYSLGGTPIQSVTQMLKEIGLYQTDYIDPYYAERGTALHVVIKQLIMGVLDERQMERDVIDGYADLRPWLKGMKAFVENHKPVPHEIDGCIAIELPLYHKELLYGFTADFYGYINLDGETLEVIIDWKNWTSVNKSLVAITGLQLVGYSEGISSYIENFKRPRRIVVNFNPKLNKGYAIHFCDNQLDYAIWNSIRNICTFKRSIGL